MPTAMSAGFIETMSPPHPRLIQAFLAQVDGLPLVGVHHNVHNSKNANGVGFSPECFIKGVSEKISSRA